MAQSQRPKAGLGLSSAITRDQLTTRNAAASSSRKPSKVKSTSGKRAPAKKETRR